MISVRNLMIVRANFVPQSLKVFSVVFGAGISECSSRAAVAALTNRSLSCPLHASGVSNMRNSIERNTCEVMSDVKL